MPKQGTSLLLEKNMGKPQMKNNKLIPNRA